MKEKSTRIVVQFKKLPGVNSYKPFIDTNPNLLTIGNSATRRYFIADKWEKTRNDFVVIVPKWNIAKTVVLKLIHQNHMKDNYWSFM